MTVSVKQSSLLKRTWCLVGNSSGTVIPEGERAQIWPRVGVRVLLPHPPLKQESQGGELVGRHSDLEAGGTRIVWELD